MSLHTCFSPPLSLFRNLSILCFVQDMNETMKYLLAGGGCISYGIQVMTTDYIKGWAELLLASKATLVPLKDGSRYRVYHFSDPRYRRLLSDLLKKDIPVFNGIFSGKDTCDALQEILDTGVVSPISRRLIEMWFPALNDLLFPYEFENPFDAPRLRGMRDVLKQLVKQYAAYATEAAKSKLNDWQPIPDDMSRDRLQEKLLGEGVINPNVKGVRMLAKYINRPVRSPIPSVVEAVDDGVDDDCGKDYGSVKHNDLTNGSVIICCPHGFVLSRNNPIPFIMLNFELIVSLYACFYFSQCSSICTNVKVKRPFSVCLSLT